MTPWIDLISIFAVWRESEEEEKKFIFFVHALYKLCFLFLSSFFLFFFLFLSIFFRFLFLFLYLLSLFDVNVGLDGEMPMQKLSQRFFFFFFFLLKSYNRRRRQRRNGRKRYKRLLWHTTIDYDFFFFSKKKEFFFLFLFHFCHSIELSKNWSEAELRSWNGVFWLENRFKLDCE